MSFVLLNDIYDKINLFCSTPHLYWRHLQIAPSLCSNVFLQKQTRGNAAFVLIKADCEPLPPHQTSRHCCCPTASSCCTEAPTTDCSWGTRHAGWVAVEESAGTARPPSAPWSSWTRCWSAQSPQVRRDGPAFNVSCPCCRVALTFGKTFVPSPDNNALYIISPTERQMYELVAGSPSEKDTWEALLIHCYYLLLHTTSLSGMHCSVFSALCIAIVAEQRVMTSCCFFSKVERFTGESYRNGCRFIASDQSQSYTCVVSETMNLKMQLQTVLQIYVHYQFLQCLYVLQFLPLENSHFARLLKAT